MVYLDNDFIRALMKKRAHNATKHTFGHALIIAGSKGKMGAAVLSSKAALVSGCGLLTTHIPARGEITVQTSLPEAMVSMDKSMDFISELPELSFFNSIGIGPGIGRTNELLNVLRTLFVSTSAPLVLDADALNLLANQPEIQSLIPQKTILTPHRKEFNRLAGRVVEDNELTSFQQAWSVSHHSIIVRKEHQTVITDVDGSVYINTSGNPGLAKGGSGDVLTGMITGFLAQGFSPLNAALIGAYIHGKAADIAIRSINENSLLATDVISFISTALNEIGTSSLEMIH